MAQNSITNPDVPAAPEGADSLPAAVQPDTIA